MATGILINEVLWIVKPCIAKSSESHKVKAHRSCCPIKADFEYLYDKPYDDKKKVRVAGPFTVESLSPHRVLAVDDNDDLIDPGKTTGHADGETDFGQMILENIKTAGVQQAHKEDKINFTSIEGVLYDQRFLESHAGSHILHDPKTAIVELIANAWDTSSSVQNAG
jgi:hypothetical protein